MSILCVIPAHNEAGAIATVILKIKALGYPVLVIDDGSVDATAKLANQAGAIILSTGRKGGKGNALRMGFADAIKEGYEALITLDGDGQHAPEDIKTFVDQYHKSGAAIINGNRMGNPKGMPYVRFMTNAVMSWIISCICRQHIPDTQCGFRLIKTDALKHVQLACKDFEIETELLIKASRHGYRIDSVAVQTIYRDEVSKIRPVKDALRFIRFIAHILFHKEHV